MRAVPNRREAAGIAPAEAAEAGDYAPYLPRREEIPPEHAAAVTGFVDGLPEVERRGGPERGRSLVERFTGPVPGDAEVRCAMVPHAWPVAWPAPRTGGGRPWPRPTRRSP